MFQNRILLFYMFDLCMYVFYLSEARFTWILFIIFLKLSLLKVFPTASKGEKSLEVKVIAKSIFGKQIKILFANLQLCV